MFLFLFVFLSLDVRWPQQYAKPTIMRKPEEAAMPMPALAVTERLGPGLGVENGLVDGGRI